MKIQKATLADINEIVRLSMQARMYHNRILGNYFNECNANFESRFLSEALSDEKAFLFVARAGAKVIGFVLAECAIKPWLTKPNVCSIENICVDENYRRQGIGRALVERVRAACEEKGVHQLTLGVFCANKNAIPFYEACGFEPLSVKMSMWV